MSQTDPFRAPDWRWREALRIATNDTAYSPGRSDTLICRVTSFLKNQNQARTSQARARLREKFPTIATVQRIRFDLRDGRRDAIEVRLLSGYPPERIAALSAVDPSVARTYLALFFDVSDRLDADDFVRTQVVGFPFDDVEEPELERRAMLWLSWIGGPLIADALLQPGRDVGFAARSEDVDEHLMAINQAVVTRAMALAPLLDRLDREQARQFTRWRAQASLQRQDDTGDPGYRKYLDNVHALLDQIEFSVGRSSIPKGDKEKYYTGRVEPNAAEWAAISRVESVPDLDARIAAGSPRRSPDDVREGTADQG